MSINLRNHAQRTLARIKVTILNTYKKWANLITKVPRIISTKLSLVFQIVLLILTFWWWTEDDGFEPSIAFLVQCSVLLGSIWKKDKENVQQGTNLQNVSDQRVFRSLVSKYKKECYNFIKEVNFRFNFYGRDIHRFDSETRDFAGHPRHFIDENLQHLWDDFVRKSRELNARVSRLTFYMGSDRFGIPDEWESSKFDAAMNELNGLAHDAHQAWLTFETEGVRRFGAEHLISREDQAADSESTTRVT